MYKSVLVATDGSTAADEAVKQAILLANIRVPLTDIERNIAVLN